ncbi:MAG: flagellin [Polyangiaceae bacterium]|nr:flagellin [Polyangiaceae bacterium]
MAMYIQTNFSALSAQKNLSTNQAQLNSSFQKLSSGFRVNTAADDAAGLAISEHMKSDIRSYAVAQRNALDGVSMAQTAEGALGEIHGVMSRMKELAVQASNGSLATADRAYLQTEFTELQGEITRIQGAATFNNKSLIGAGAAAATKFQVGIGTAASDSVTVNFDNVDLSGVTAGISLTGADETNAYASITALNTAIDTVSTARARFGAAMNRLDVSSATVQTMSLNLSAANSRIRDVDVATETATMSRNQVLTQAGVSVLSQANQLPQMAFGLLRG